MDGGEPPPTDPAPQDTTRGTAPRKTLGDGLVAATVGFVAEAPASGGHVVITAAAFGASQGGQPASQGGQQARQGSGQPGKPAS